MKEKKKYIIARAITPWGIKRNVNKMIKEGYRPIGGIQHGILSLWNQAMVLKDRVEVI